MKCLIFGGYGFVGSRLAKQLEQTGHQVFAVSRRNGFDLSDYPQVKQSLETLKPDVIYNCAAHVGGLHYVSKVHAMIAHDNMQMALNLYHAVQEAYPSALVINPLSNCSYPGEREIYTESEWLDEEVHDSVYSYGNAKRFLYVLSRCYAEQYGIKTHNFLVPNAFGPGDATDPNKVHALNGMIVRMVQAHRNNDTEFDIWGTGKPIREWIYVDDVARLLQAALALEPELTYPVNFAQQKGYSIHESAEFIAQAIGFKGKLTFKPEYQDGAPIKILDATRFKGIFPDYQFTDHKQGIQATVKYYMQQF